MNIKVCILCVSIALGVCLPEPSPAAEPGADLVLSESPPAPHGEGHGKRGNRGGQGHAAHQATAERMWYLNLHDLGPGAEAIILRPDGVRAAGSLRHGGDGWSVAVDTRPLDGSLDGVFNLYVIDRAVSGGVLTVRAAKANMINHSCGWGHAFKFDDVRLLPKHAPDMPLEIVANGLWDRNFHTKTMSGDRFAVQVLRNGKPAAGASVSFTTGSGWTKTVETGERGEASVQLIRDYYPEQWSLFEARKRGTVLVTAQYETAERGQYRGKAYGRTRYVATLPWSYVPQRREYASYAYGLGIACLVAVLAGIGIFVYRERRSRPCREVRFDERS